MAGESNHKNTSARDVVKLRKRNGKKERRMMLEEFLFAMKEDLSEWLSSLMKIKIDPKDFMATVENGVILCHAANAIQTAAEKYLNQHRKTKLKIPNKGVHVTMKNASSGSFVARDNVANFITWCRELGIGDSIILESEDLVLHKNEKRVILTLLDVARKANKFGVKPPEIVVLEEEIDRELELDRKRQLAGQVERTLVLEKDNNLDDLVKEVVDQCSCHSKFPVKKLADGKYKVGKQKTLIFVRVMRNHVMVRVGGGWDTLTHYVEKHDPCRVQVGGEIDENGKCGHKYSQDESPRRAKKHSIDHSWDGESVCSTESSGSSEAHSSASGETPVERNHIRGNEAAPCHHHNHLNVSTTPSSRRRTKSVPNNNQSPRQNVMTNGQTSNTHQWIQNHVDHSSNNDALISSPRSRQRTNAISSPLTQRRNTTANSPAVIRKSMTNSPLASRKSIASKDNRFTTNGQRQSDRSQTLPVQRRTSNGHVNDDKKLIFSTPIKVPPGSSIPIARPSFTRSRTLDITNENNSRRRQRTSTVANGNPSVNRAMSKYNMVGRREKSMDSMSLNRSNRSPRARLSYEPRSSQYIGGDSIKSQIRLKKQGIADTSRDCRVTDANRSQIRPCAAVFTV